MFRAKTFAEKSIPLLGKLSVGELVDIYLNIFFPFLSGRNIIEPSYCTQRILKLFLHVNVCCCFTVVQNQTVNKIHTDKEA